MSDVLDLTCDLIARRSITTEDAGCQAMLAARLERAGFRCDLPAGRHQVGRRPE